MYAHVLSLSQVVNRGSIYIYSAYMDSRPLAPPSLRVFTLINRTLMETPGAHLADDLLCVYWERGGDKGSLVPVDVSPSWALKLLGHKHENKR